MIIAIDGPSGAGKSTVAKLVSQKLKFQYVDTGAMYRALAYKAHKNNIEIADDAIETMLKDTVVDYCNNSIYIDGQNVESCIRNEIISRLSSEIAILKVVREKMVALQRNIAKKNDVILDGRDIGTYVFPNAEFKFFITASVETRAKRRYDELIQKCHPSVYADVLKDIKNRDINDSTRKISPLKMAEDAILIDTTNMTVEEAVNQIISLVEEKKNVL